VKIPQTPPRFPALLKDMTADRMLEISRATSSASVSPHYVHWDKLRRYAPPEGLSREEWWLAHKLSRMGALRPLELLDRKGEPFKFAIPSLVQEELHRIDRGAGFAIGMPEVITVQQRDQYVIRSLMEEAITSSQLEGALTTREVAKEMIRSGRSPRDTSEKMILNNYLTMQWVRSLKNEPLTPELIFGMHRRVTEGTLDDHTAAGRFRYGTEAVRVEDDYGTVFHLPPVADELPKRLSAMCDFANETSPQYFVHPVLRAIILHFWLAYDHPFVDGNGRTARALYYWSMLRSGYWLSEFISISQILRKAPAKYARSFLYTETDDNDLTYFVVAQTRVIRQAIQALHSYIEMKMQEIQQIEQHVRALALELFNHRQVEIVRHALKHPYVHYTIASHQQSHGVTYQTARADLLNLVRRGLLEQRMRGRQLFFSVPSDLQERLRSLKSSSAGATQVPFSFVKE
jgi:Fic family protein